MEKVFWSDTIKKTIIQANIDGSGSQTILNTDIGKIGKNSQNNYTYNSFFQLKKACLWS